MVASASSEGFRGEGFRLSPQQKHLWLLQQPDRNSAYRAQCAISIRGKLDRAVLGKAIEQVADRHEILRTSFHRQLGMKVPFQVISGAAAISWQDVDLSQLQPNRHRESLESIFEQEKTRPFNLDRAALLHLLLVALSPENHTLIVGLPSLCADAATLENLTREIAHSYALCLNGEDRSGQPLQYADYSEWQNELIEADDDDAKSGKQYWEKHGGYFPSLTLPFESRAGDRQPTSGLPKPGLRSYALAVASDLLAKVGAIARNQGSSVNAYMLACWQSLLWRLTGRPEVVIGAMFDGREYEELQGALGLFARCLPIGCEFRDGIGFGEALAQVEKARTEACDWQQYFSFEQSRAFITDDLPHAIGFEFHERPPEYSAAGVSFSISRHYSLICPFKLKLSCIRVDGALTAEFHYDPDLFQADLIARVAAHFEALLRSSVENPEAAVEQLAMLDASERDRLVVEFNRTEAGYGEGGCIHELFEQQADRTPESVAVVSDDQQLTYRELNSKANQLAHLLRKHGVGPDARVGLCMERSARLFVGLLGILKAGGAYVALNPDHPKSRLSYQLSDVQAAVLITEQKLAGRLPDFGGEVISLDADQTALEREPKSNPARTALPQNLCYVIYTSGSTGTPKGVAVTHQSLVNYTHFICEKLRLKEASADRALHFATVSTVAADLGNTCIFPSLASGGCLHVVSYEVGTEANLFAGYISGHSIDVLKIVPSHLNALLSSREDADVLPQKYLILGGEALSFDLLDRISRMSDCQVINHYGPTETTVGSLTCSLGGGDCSEWKSSTVPIGRPVANTEVYVLDKRLTPVPMGVAGELYIGGAGLARGYWNQPEQAAECFIPNPFSNGAKTRLYKTGDLARHLPGGNLEFIGRVDHQVKVRGFRIEPGEIEAALVRHEAVRQSVVTACEHAPGDIRLVAYVVPAAALDADELREWLRAELPDYMMPSHFVALKAIPLTPNGKADRRALPVPDQGQAGSERVVVAPRTSVEEAMAKVWAELLGVERISVHDNFFDLGGHSLLVTQVVSRIRKIFQVELPLRSFFESPTVADLAERIQLARQEETSRLLAELEQLSNEEAERLIEIESREQSDEGNLKALSSGL